MANNYLSLVHRPTGKRFVLAKRHGTSWGTLDNPMNDSPLDLFFEECFEATNFDGLDDFELNLEDNSGAPHISKERQ